MNSMLPQEAFSELKDMDCLEINPLSGFFKIAKQPKRFNNKKYNERDWTLFIKCVQTLGAYSVSLDGKRAPVEIQCGSLPDEIQFRVGESQ